MVELPRKGIFWFKFKKADGTIRYAAGTQDPDVINHYHTFSENKTERNPTVQPYFDLDALSFRSFKVENFIELITEQEYTDGTAI